MLVVLVDLSCLIFLPPLTPQYFCLVLFHCAEQRRRVSGSILPADAGFPDAGGHRAAHALGGGWHLVVRTGGGDRGICHFHDVFAGEEKTIWVFVGALFE